MNSKKIQILFLFITGLSIIFLLLLSSCTALNDSSLKNLSGTKGSELISKPAFESDSKLICILQNADYEILASIEFDVAVVDPDDSKLSKDNIADLHSQSKALIAYLSIGEAENYRSYWKKDWKPGNPVFLDEENPNWKGNFKVKYWYSDWQKIVFDSISKIIDKGYDGIYLDLVDAYDYFDDKGYSYARLYMVNFVTAISKNAKNQNGDFLIIPQNSEELITENGYLNAIDGVGRENLWFVGDNLQDKDELVISLGYLNQIIKANRFVFAINYSQKEENIKSFISQAQKYGFIPYVGPRELDSIGDTIND
ncbi:MAG: endo alpha-1,4 polygalactosaminidase [Actinobacteria bacterium]|nr:endo alpha-1,4 polygalactosaminidase [Actinomycetota bacterium]